MDIMLLAFVVQINFNYLFGFFFIFFYFFFYSIGSLGAGNSNDYVSNVIVNRALLSGTTNGLRIKTWQVRIGFQEIVYFFGTLPFTTTPCVQIHT
jgi:hypothetical protein